MLGQFPVSGKAISVQGKVPTTNVYAQVLSTTQANSTLAWSKQINKVISATSVTNTTFGNTPANLPTLGINNTAIGTVVWVTPGNVTANDGSSATTNGATISATSTNILVCNGFNFSVPTNAIILGVQVIGHWTSQSSGSTTNSVQLWNGVDTTITDYIGTAQAVSGTTSTNGSSNNLWNATLTPTIVNSSSFGCAFSVACSALTTFTWALDYCTMQVWYALPPFPTLQKFVNKTYSATQSGVGIGNNVSTTIPYQNFTTTPTIGAFSGGATWSNPGNALTSDGTYATQVVPTSNNTNDLRFYLKDFALPAGATVVDFGCTVLWRSTNASISNLKFQFYDGVSGSEIGYGADGYFILSTNNTWETHTFALGTGNISAFALSGPQLSAAWWNAATSTIDMWGYTTSGTTITIDVDVYQMTVVYTLPGSNIQKTVTKVLSSSSTSVPSLVKSSLKTLSTVSNSVVTWLASKLSSTTTYYQTMMATQGQTATFIKAISNLSAMSVVQVSVSSLSKLTSKYWSASSTSVPTVVKYTNKGLSTSSTSVPTIIKQTGKALTRSSTSVPTLVKSVNKPWSVSSTSIPVWIKSVAKTWSISSTSIPVWIKSLAKPWSISSTSIPVWIKSLAKPWSISSTSVPTVVKSTNKILSAVSTSVPTFLRSILHFVLWSATQGSTSTWAKSINKPWSVSSTSVPSIVKRYSHTWSVSSTSVPSFIKQVNKVWSVSSATIATFLKGALHYVIMSATQGQTAQWIKSTNKNWSLSSTSVPSIKKQMNKGWSVSSTSISSLFKQFNHTWSLSSTSVPTLVKSVNKPWSVSSTSVPKLVKQINKSWSVSSVSIPTLVKSIFKPLSIVSTSVPTFTKQVNKIWAVVSISIPTFLKGALHYVIMSATQSSTAQWIKSTGKSLTSISTSVPSVSKSIQKGLFIVSTSVPSLNKGMFRLWSIAQPSISSFIKQTKKSLFGSSTSVVNLNKYTNKTLTINSTTVGSFNKGFFKTWSATQGSISTMDTLRQAFVRPFNLLANTLNDWKQYALTIYQSYYQFTVDKRLFEADAKATTETIPYQWQFLTAQPYSATVSVRLLNGTDNNPAAILQGSPIIGTNSVTQVITGGNNGCIYNLITTIRMKDGTVKVLETYLPVSTI